MRLYQGSYGQETLFSHDPASIALQWEHEGAQRIHLVDLDGARAGYPVNDAAIKAVLSSAGVPVQVGGGVRSLEAARRLLEMGVQRVVFGTAALREPELVKHACDELGPEAIIVSIDSRDGNVAVQGWTETTTTRATALMQSMAQAGVRRFIFTDVAADGTLQGPNLEAVRSLTKFPNVALISAGGIASVGDLERLARVGVEGAIIGSALYRGTIKLREAIQRLN